MGELKYIVMDGCMLLNKSSTISQSVKTVTEREDDDELMLNVLRCQLTY